jgi:NAD(P)-dependent dehydrogenase (short-subunit alcohol dehydrogenase family)
VKKAVLITGASGGIGHATAALFAEEGWQVIGTDRRRPQSTSCFEHFIDLDISDPAAAETAFAGLAVNRLDALVNNAAVTLARRLIDTSVDEWDAIMNVNVRAAHQAIRCLFPLLKGSGGAVVNVSSVHAVATSEDLSAYAASKGALCALTRAAALELAEAGIRVNAVLPGAIDTPMLRAGLNRHRNGTSAEDAYATLALRTPLRRVAAPREIAQVILFLADNARSSFITGQTLVADGGATARLSTE